MLSFSFHFLASQQNQLDFLLTFITSSKSISQSMDKMKTLASDLLQKIPRSRTQTRLNVLTYDNIIDWKETRDLSQAKLKEAVDDLDLRRPRSESSLPLFTKTISQALSDNSRKGVQSAILVISDGAPQREIVEYLNSLAKDDDNRRVTLVMTSGKVRDLPADIVVEPKLQIVSGDDSVGDVDAIVQKIKPGDYVKDS